MFLPAACFILLICRFACATNVTVIQVEESKCKKMYTYGYGYRQFYHVSQSSAHRSEGGLLDMRLWVKARSDAHILLSGSPSPEDTDPVYEVVLGAGKNTFSDIRRRRRSATKASAFTNEILSGTELRGFWIKTNEEGLVMVGKEGEDLPFMEWQDPEPLHIEYFSFCTWSGVAGKWLYDCALDPEDDMGSVKVQPVLTARERLRKALLTDYDVYSSPLDPSQLLRINVGIQVNHIQLDSKKSVMSAGCVFALEWSDSKMIWNPDDFSNLSVINLIHNEIWQPLLINFNAAGKGLTLQGQDGMRVSANGKVSRNVRSNLQTRCQLDLQHWPWDTQTCNIQLGLWNQPDNIQLMLMENRTKLELQAVASEWEILRLDSNSTTLRRLWLDPTTDSSDSTGSDYDTTPALTFTFTLHRVDVGVNYIFAIPLLVVVVMSLACFWLEPLSPEKLAMNCLLLLLLSGFLLGLSTSLTAPSQQTPLLLRAYIHVWAVLTCVTVGTILISRVASQPQHQPVPRAVHLALTTHFVSTFFCLPPYAENEQEYGQMRGRSSANSVERNGTDLSDFGRQDEPNPSWNRLAIFCDRVTFIVAAAAYTTVLFH